MKMAMWVLTFLLVAVLFGASLLASCARQAQPDSPPTATITATPYPQATRTLVPTSVPPTPASLGESVTEGGLQVMVDQADMTDAYITEYGSSREPSSGQKFLWVHINLLYTGAGSRSLPSAEHYSALYDGGEFKASYGHRQDHTDYTTLGRVIYSDQQVEGWLRFSLPELASLHQIRFAYMPEGIRATFDSPKAGDSWAEHLVYLWELH